MNFLDEEFPFVKKPEENTNRRNESVVGSEIISEICLNILFNNSENTTGRTESDNQVLAEDSNQHKVNTIPTGLSDSINNDHGNFTSTVKTSSESPLFSKADDILYDSSGSYHTAMSSEIPENLSDCSGPFEDIEELPTDHEENQDVSESGMSQLLTDSQKEHRSDQLNSSENGNSLNGCSLTLQSNCCEGQEQIFMNKHKRELCELNAEGETCELGGEIKFCRLDGKNEPDDNTEYKQDVSVTEKPADEKKLFGYEAASGPLEEKNVFSSAMAAKDFLLTANSNSYAQGIVSKSTEYDLSESGTDIKKCKGNGDQQVQLSITDQNSKTGERSSTVQLAKNQKTGVSIHESSGCYLHLGLNNPEEMFQIDKEFENSFKSDSYVNGKRVYADCMSETSSVASELDETDYEVRRLTASAFQSLSCPNDDHLDIYNSRAFIDFSSPLSEECHSTNRSSTCNEFNYTGAFDDNEECSDSGNTACALHAGAEESNNVISDDSFDRVQFECVDVVVETQDKSKDFRASRTVPKRQIELRKRQRSELKVFTSRGAINSCAFVDPEVETGNKEETLECLQNCENMPFIENTINTDMKDEDHIDKQLQRATSTDESLTKNKFASCLITNVISKKMQFEQDLKMEQGLDKNMYSISPTPTIVKKEDFDFSPIVPQQIQHDDSTSKSEPNNSAAFIQGNFKKNGCELNDKNIEENRSVGQKHCCSCLMYECDLILDEQKNKNIFNCCGSSVFRNWSESNTDSQSETRAEGTLELNAEKSLPMLNDLSTNASEQEKNMNAPCISEGKYVTCMSQATEEKLESIDRVQSEQTPYEDRTSDVQSDNISCKINATSNILALKSPKMLHNSQTANMKQTNPFSIVKVLSPTMDSNTTSLDLNYQTFPTSLKLESGLEQDKVSLSDVSTKNKMKGPTYHVRDVRKLVRNTYSALTFCATKAKSDVPEEVHNPSSLEQSFPATLHKPSMNGSPLSPIFIQCQSISRKADNDDNSCASVDKKYWTCTGSSDSSRIFSSDFKLPIPLNKQENKVISAKRIDSQSYSIKENGSNATEYLTGFTNKITPDRKMQALSISNYEESKLSFMKLQIEAEEQKKHSGNLVLNNEIADLVPGKSKQKNEPVVGLENLNTHLSSSASTTENTEISLIKMEPNRDIQSEPENEDEFSTNSNSNKEGFQMSPYKDEPRGEVPDSMQNQTTFLGNSPSNRNIDSSHRKLASIQDIQTKLEIQNNQLGISSYNNDHAELTNGKSDPQNDIQVKLKSQNRLFCNSTSSNKDMDVLAWKDDPNKDINMRLENQNKCLRISTSNDKETQTPPRKGKHKNQIQLRLGNQNKMLDSLTLDNEDVELSHGKVELKRELHVSFEDQNKHFENPTLNVEDTNLLLDDPESQIELEQDNQSELVLKNEDGNISPSINKHKNELQRGLQNETKSLDNSSSNCKEIKLSPTKSNLKGEIHDVMESQNELLNHCIQKSGDIQLPAVESKNEEEFKIEPITQKTTDKVELIPTEKVGLTFISELQPFKDSNTISIVSEEERQSPTKDCSESSNIEIVDEQLSSAQIPNNISLIPAKTTEKSDVSIESSSCPETINISANMSLQETEAEDVHDKSIFSPDIQNAAANELLASQTPSSFTNLNVRSLDIINPVVNLSNDTTHDQAKQQSLEMEMPAINKAVTPEEALALSDPVNYLTIPIKEHKPQVSPQIQMPALPQPVILKPDHYLTTISPHQHWKTLDSHKQEETLSHQFLEEFQSFGTFPQHPFYALPQVPNQPEHHLVHFPSTGQTPNAVEKCYKVPQSPPFTDNHRLPCFQYSQAPKKVLIDPETGKHYFLEAPIQSARKVLLDPETGCYVEVIIPQQTYGGLYQAPMSPYVLYPNALRPSYTPRMQYSDLLSTPPFTYPGPSPGPPEVQMQSHLNGTNASATDKQDHKNNTPKNQLAESKYMESAYYIPTGMSVNPNPAQASTQVISMHSKSCVEVKNNSTVILSSKQI
uniref:serine-rich adhesin for platelets-like n=1 Tax=Pristiophorus japonicus TaxID=55135 RepID=UPI00398EE655